MVAFYKYLRGENTGEGKEPFKVKEKVWSTANVYELAINIFRLEIRRFLTI